MRFTLRQVSYFVAAAEAGSITLAAQNVNVSQPSVSEAIAKLEAEFGLQLFVRHRATGLSLTPAGARFLPAAQAMLRQADGLHAIADEIATSVSGPMRIGSFRTFTPVFVTELAKAFRDAEPRVEVTITEGDEAAMIAKLQRGDIDLAFTYDLHVDASIAFEPVAALPTHVVLPEAHPVGIATLKGSRKVRTAQAFEAFVKARVTAGGLPGLAPMAGNSFTNSLT
jgi:DNA-binding transcriptional LysR family regulator